MVRSPNSLILIGSGPGIGQSVASLFATKRYNAIGLVARRQAQLDIDRKAVEAAAPSAKVYTYVADIADGPKLSKTLEKITSEIAVPETVFFNAAVIRPTSIAEETEEAMLYDFKVQYCSLPHLTEYLSRFPDMSC